MININRNHFLFIKFTAFLGRSKPLPYDIPISIYFNQIFRFRYPFICSCRRHTFPSALGPRP